MARKGRVAEKRIPRLPFSTSASKSVLKSNSAQLQRWGWLLSVSLARRYRESKPKRGGEGFPGIGAAAWWWRRPGSSATLRFFVLRFLFCCHGQKFGLPLCLRLRPHTRTVCTKTAQKQKREERESERGIEPYTTPARFSTKREKGWTNQIR